VSTRPQALQNQPAAPSAAATISRCRAEEKVIPLPPGADPDTARITRDGDWVRVKFNGDRDPDYVTVPLTDPALFQCGYLHMEDIGTANFTNAEVEGLRAFLLKGGFLWTDDAWGSYAWDQWTEQMQRLGNSHGAFTSVTLPRLDLERVEKRTEEMQDVWFV